MAEKRKWFAIYTKPRWEKKVFQLLKEKGVEVYCPINKVKRKWSDRIKVVEEPLFKSYVFVQVSEEEKSIVRMTNGVVNFVYWLGKPAVIKEKEINAIRKFLDEFEEFEVERMNDIQPQHKVLINSGVFMDKQGVVRKVLRNKVEVVLESIGYRIVATINKSKISVLPN